MDASSAFPSSQDAAPSEHRRSASLQLPRIRTSRHAAIETSRETTTTVDNASSVDGLALESSTPPAAVTEDVVSPLSPTASERRRESEAIAARRDTETASGTQPLARLLGRLDVGERCRWSGLVIIVFYVMTSLLWPSLFVSAMGILCGTTGVVACHEPYTIQKISWVFVYAFLNAAMIGALVWTAMDQFFLGSGGGATNISYFYTVALLVFSLVIHVRAYQTCWELIVECQLLPMISAAMLPESWRRTQSPVERVPAQGGGVDQASGDTQLTDGRSQDNDEDDEGMRSVDEDRSSSSSVHSFEIDIHSYHPLTSPSSREMSRAISVSQLASPGATPFRRMDDVAM